MNAQQELVLRKHIRNKIAEQHEKILQEQKAIHLQEKQIRKIVRGILLKEASDVNFETYAQSTGINILAKTMKQISNILQRAYMTMTSSAEQRESFRAHILRNVVDLFIRVDLLSDESELIPKKEEIKVKEKTEEIMEDLDTDINEQEEDVDAPKAAKPEAVPAKAEELPKLPGVEPEKEKKVSDQIKAKEFIELPGEDPTGRNIAMETFPLISSAIADNYALLSLPKDKEDYKNYMLANLKAYFDQYEQKIAASVAEPYSAEYEKVKEKYSRFEEPTQQQIAESAAYFKVLKIITNGKQVL